MFSHRNNAINEGRVLRPVPILKAGNNSAGVLGAMGAMGLWGREERNRLFHRLGKGEKMEEKKKETSTTVSFQPN